MILVKTKSKKEKHKLRRMAYKLNKKMQKVKEKKGLKKKNLFLNRMSNQVVLGLFNLKLLLMFKKILKVVLAF